MMARPIVMFGEDWGGLPSSTQHLAKQFARDRDVVWVNSIGLRRPRLGARDAIRVTRKVSSMLAKSRRAAEREATPERLTVVNPRAVSWPGNQIAGAINRHVLGSQIRRVLRKNGLERPVLWTSLPSAVDLVGEFDESAVVYYCCDDFESLEGVDHEPVGRMERRLVEQADLVFTTNDHLAAKLAPQRHQSLPHGVDADLFMASTDRPADLPQGKVALFYGSLSSWLDIELLTELADLRRDWCFVLIGTPQVDLSPLRSRTNIAILGPRPHAQLPSYVQHASAALLPFRNSPQIQACNPLKLREYLASGTPVISTAFPALKPYREGIHIADDAQSFSRALDALDGSDAARRARQSLVSGETWDARAAQALAAIDGLQP